MNIDELRAKIVSSKALGHEFVQLTAPHARHRRPRSNEGRAWKGGPQCRYIGQLDDGRWLIDVKLADIETWLAKVDASEQ